MANIIKFEKLRVNVKITFISSYNAELVEEFRKLKPDITYNSDKTWSILLNLKKYDEKLDNISTYSGILKFYSEEQSNKLRLFLETKNKDTYEILNKENEERNKLLMEFDNKILKYSRLYKHQIEGVKKLIQNNSTLLADEQGVGKTIQAITYSEIMEFKKILVICPASLKLNWKNEIRIINKNANICVLPNQKYTDNTKYFIINYDMLIKEYVKHKNIKGKMVFELREDSFLNKVNFDCILIDEAQAIKGDSQRTKAVLYLADRIKHVIPMTGTPIKNKVRDLWNILVAIKHPMTKNGFFSWAMKYCDAHKDYFGWHFDGSSNLEELHAELDKYMIRRLQDDCLDLPEMTVNKIYLELSKSDRIKYDNAFNDYIEYCRTERFDDLDEDVKNNKINNIEMSQHLVQIGILKQICAKAKLDLLYEQINDILDDPSKKIVIFSQYTDVINSIYTVYHKIAVKLTGSTMVDDRQRAVDKFQNDDKVRLFVSNIIAGGTGITLTRSDTMIFVDMTFVPSDHSQAEMRIKRIGQSKKTNVFYYIFEDTIEDDIYRILANKKSIANKVIDNIDSTSLDDGGSIISELISTIKEKI